MNNQIVVFNRKKDPGKNSIEEIFYSLLPHLAVSSFLEVPEKKVTLSAIIKNIRFAYKNRGKVSHITGDVHYIILGTGRNTVLTIHDIQSTLTGTFLAKFLKKIIWIWMPVFLAKKITVISDFTKSELIKTAPFAKHKTSVIHNPYNDKIKFKSKVFKRSKPIILHIGTKENKNLPRVIEALCLIEIPCHLNIVGKLTTRQIDLLESTKIEYTNVFNITFSEIAEAYAECDIVSFPSLYEGFGMPIIEANKSGRAVLTSNICSMPEIAGDAACFVNPLSVTEISNGFKKIITDELYRNNLIDKGFQNAERFNPAVIAKRYQKLYDELLL